MNVNYIKNIAVNLAHKWILGKRDEAVEEYREIKLDCKGFFALGKLIEVYVLCIEKKISRSDAVKKTAGNFYESGGA